MKTRILYIEDEPFLARIVKETLELKGYDVLHRPDGNRVTDMVGDYKPDICVFDVMLPHTDGFALGNMVRNLHPKLPIIFLTAKTQTEDVVKGFSSGGTDYLKKPFSMEELMIRIENQLKIAGADKGKVDSLPEEIMMGRCRFYPKRYELMAGDKLIKLSNRESQILNILCNNRNSTIERSVLLNAVWGDDTFFNSRTLDVYIRKLRDYLSAEPNIEIITLKGKGYHFVINTAPQY